MTCNLHFHHHHHPCNPLSLMTPPPSFAGNPSRFPKLCHLNTCGRFFLGFSPKICKRRDFGLELLFIRNCLWIGWVTWVRLFTITTTTTIRIMIVIVMMMMGVVVMVVMMTMVMMINIITRVTPAYTTT